MRAASIRTAVAVMLFAPAAVTGATQIASALPLPDRGYVLAGGETKAIYSFKDAIRQSVWVKAPDGDGDGKKDLVTADIIRPRELDHVTKVPVILEASPYYLCCGRGNEGERKTYDGSGNPLKFPLFYDNFFEPRGYAVVLVDMSGTARATGCADEGAASDIGSVRAVIDWLNGRARAEDIDGRGVTAYWTNGTVGMIGKSYDGTLAEGVAGTGVKGLVTIVPISAISSWYDYDRSQNLPFAYDYPAGLSATVESDRTQHVDCSAVNQAMNQHDGDETGTYTTFWSKRDYRAAPSPSVGRITASVFVVHGLQDTNVKTVTFGRWLSLLRKHDVVTKIWLSRLGHTDPFDYRRALWVDTLHRWFDNQLLGIDNGILDEPRVDIEISPGEWVHADTWPVSTGQQIFTFHGDGSMTKGAPGKGTGNFINDPDQSEAEAIANGANSHRLLYVTGSLKADLRLSGEPTVRLEITPDGRAAQVGVALVDYGTHDRVRDDGEGNKTLGTQSCYGKSVSYDDACYFDSVENVMSTPLAVVARGWARLKGNQANDLTVDLAYNDVVVPAGDQLGLAIFAASPDWAVVLDQSATPYAVDLGLSSLTVPVVGSVTVGGDAGDLRQVPSRVPADAVPGTGGADRIPW